MTLHGKKILVTGADGFIGSHLVERLLEEGASVYAFVFYNSFNSWGWLDTLPPEKRERITVISGDIRDPAVVADAVRDSDIVFHLAALIAIPYSYTAPESFIDTNIRGTLNVLQAVRAARVEKVIVTSTSEVYGTARYVPIDEAHPLQGQSPYSASKIGADMLAESFWRSFDVPAVIVRPFNAYGPRQSARAIVPTVITQLLSGAQSLQLGRTDPVRDLTFVEDTVDGFVTIAQCDAAVDDVVHIATGVGHTIGDVAQTIMSIIGREVPIETDAARIRPADSEVERLIGSTEKLQALTGWKPETSLEDGLRATVEWFRTPDNLSRYKTDIYNI